MACQQHTGARAALCRSHPAAGKAAATGLAVSLRAEVRQDHADHGIGRRRLGSSPETFWGRSRTVCFWECDLQLPASEKGAMPSGTFRPKAGRLLRSGGRNKAEVSNPGASGTFRPFLVVRRRAPAWRGLIQLRHGRLASAKPNHCAPFHWLQFLLNPHDAHLRH
jgi:hypothetical protein